MRPGSRGWPCCRHPSKTYAEVLEQNQCLLGDFWAKSDITIDGDPETQQGIRFCIFQMQQTYRGVIDGANIGAKGLTGEAYNGNAFWDTETYCLPFYLFSNPSAAKSLIDFRYKTLPQALARAKDLDCEGACYPVATIRWHGELHALAARQPAVPTNDGCGVCHLALCECDRRYCFPESRRRRDAGADLPFPCQPRTVVATGKFGYYAVMGPDEFQMMVNNNAYTNYMAKRTFEFTLQVLGRNGSGETGLFIAG